MADTVVRCVTLPVAVPLGTDPAGAPWTWASFDAALLPAFRLATDLANWCVRRLFTLDDPTSAKAPDAVTKWYGYADAGASYPDAAKWAGAMAGLNLVTRAVQRKYVQQRFDVMVRHRSDLLTYRFPQPYPVHNQNWHPEYEHGAHACVRLNLPGVGAVALALKTRAGFGRQLAQFRQLCDGTAKKGEAALYRDRKGALLLKMVGHFQRRERAGADNVCYLHTDPNALLVAEINGRSVTVTNGDHLRRAHAVIRTVADRHRRFLQRTGEDKKREVRMDRAQRASLNRAIEARCAKQRDRIDTAVKQIAAQVARFCERQRVGLMAYDDSVKDFLPDGFPWHALKERVAQLFVGEMGGELVDGQPLRSVPEVKERQSWLELARNTALAGRRAVATANRSGSHPAVTPPTNSAPKRSRAPRIRSKSVR